MTAGFGIERIGLLALRFPRATLLAIALVLPWCLYGASQLTYSSDVREIFRSQAPEFATLETVARHYPETERDVLLAVQGPDLFQADRLEALRTVHLELSFVEGVGSVLSMFSAREPPRGERVPEAVFPAELDGVDLRSLRARVAAHPLVADRLLSADATLALFVIALAERELEVDALRRVAADIERTAAEALQGTGLHTALTGASIMRIEIVATLIRDQRMFIGAGIAIGLGLFWLMFRRPVYPLLAAAPVAVAIAWLFALMWLLGQDVNVLTNVVPALVLVLVFSDALHLLVAVRRNVWAGQDVEGAIAEAVLEVGPACVLTSLTTMLALLSLLLVAHPFIADFGMTAALGTGLAFLATLTLVPALAVLVFAKVAPPSPAERGGAVEAGIERLCQASAKLVAARPGAVLLAGVLVTAVAAGLYALNAPSYRYSENLPRGNPAFLAIGQIDAHLAGSSTLRVLIEWPRDHALASERTLAAITDVHGLIEQEPAFGAVSSLHGLEQWLARENGVARAGLFEFLQEVDAPIAERFLSEAHGSALVTAQFGDLDAAVLAPILDRLKARLAALQASYPEARFTITGLVPLSAWASTEMIGDLNVSLLTAIGVIIVLIALALRSAMAGLVSLLPNLMPIAIGGAYLYLSSRGLQFTSVIAFTIGFGLAVDSTIHVLNRYRLERGRGSGPRAALDATVAKIGPVVIVGAIVLAAGMASTLLSQMPMLRLFGTVAVIVLLTALIGALLLLPATLSVLERWRGRTSPLKL